MLVKRSGIWRVAVTIVAYIYGESGLSEVDSGAPLRPETEIRDLATRLLPDAPDRNRSTLALGN